MRAGNTSSTEIDTVAAKYKKKLHTSRNKKTYNHGSYGLLGLVRDVRSHHRRPQTIPRWLFIVMSLYWSRNRQSTHT